MKKGVFHSAVSTPRFEVNFQFVKIIFGNCRFSTSKLILKNH